MSAKPLSHFDLAIIGAGAGGLVVASVAAQLDLSVLLVERGEMGGDCLNYGCVPSKALLAAGHAAHIMRKNPFGVHSKGGVDVDYAKVHDHVHGVIAAIAPHDSQERFESLGCTVIRGEGRFVDHRTLAVGDQRYTARRFVIATGSHPFVPPIDGLDTVDYFTNETIFQHKKPIDHLVVIGGGAIGCEMAQAWCHLGAKVSLIEGGPSILGKDDPECVAIARQALQEDGIALHEGFGVSSVASDSSGGVVVHCSNRDGSENRTVSGSHLLVAVGRRPNIAALDLDCAGIAHKPAGITVDSQLRTTNRRVYAVGDVTGGLMFTHVAGYEAGIVIGSALFRARRKVDYRAIPWTTFITPEVAQVGLTEDQASKTLKPGQWRVLRWQFNENDRAQAEHQTHGLVKAVVSRRGVVLGASIVGPRAGELISTWALLVQNRWKVSHLIGTVFPYPTLSETAKRLASTYYSARLFSPGVKHLVRWLQKLP